MTLDPSYRHPPFRGWGCSLAWFAHATGRFPTVLRERLAELVFGEGGLNLNIARYNIGGGNAPDVPANYLKAGAAMPGFWRAPDGTTRADRDWWDPDDPGHWNPEADPHQRWWVERIKDRVDVWEAFSNSPPWFQTVSGYVSGGTDPADDQLRVDRLDAFATYLVRVMDLIEDRHGIRFNTVDPLNEPGTTYWATAFDPGGRPVGKQEGAHAGADLQQRVYLALQRALGAPGVRTAAQISAMDETSPELFVRSWSAYSDAARSAIGQLNVHTYGTRQRTVVRDLAKSAGKPLWMSEVDGTWGAGTDFTGMAPGLGIARRITDDLRELEPQAWILWQPIEDHDHQAEIGANWGVFQVSFAGEQAGGGRHRVRVNRKFDTIRHFTRYLRPGCQLIATDCPSATAALVPGGEQAVVVYVNDTPQARILWLDLNGFATIRQEASVTPVVTDATQRLRRGAPVAVEDGFATVAVPAESVTTLLIDGVGGIGPAGAGLPVDQDVRLLPIASPGECLTVDDDRVRLTTIDAAPAWRWQPLDPVGIPRTRYALVQGGRRLAVRNATVVTELAHGPADAAAQWIASTTGDGRYTVISVGGGLLLQTAGAGDVGLGFPDAGPGQLWTVRPARV